MRRIPRKFINVPNTGSYTFLVPNNVTSTGRILVEAVNNIFFDINDKNFAITPAVGIDEALNHESISITPNPASDNIQINLTGSLRGKVEIRINDVSGRIVKSNSYLKQQEGLVDNINIDELAKGVYIVSFMTEKGTSTQRFVKD